MKIGDLVRFKGDEINKKYMGVVTGTIEDPYGGGPANAYVFWNRIDEDNPIVAGWAFVYALEVINECR
jgi:hypothetical protein